MDLFNCLGGRCHFFCLSQPSTCVQFELSLLTQETKVFSQGKSGMGWEHLWWEVCPGKLQTIAGKNHLICSGQNALSSSLCKYLFVTEHLKAKLLSSVFIRIACFSARPLKQEAKPIRNTIFWIYWTFLLSASIFSACGDAEWNNYVPLSPSHFFCTTPFHIPGRSFSWGRHFTFVAARGLCQLSSWSHILWKELCLLFPKTLKPYHFLMQL